MHRALLEPHVICIIEPCGGNSLSFTVRLNDTTQCGMNVTTPDQEVLLTDAVITGKRFR
jgi:hypothetical protein